MPQNNSHDDFSFMKTNCQKLLDLNFKICILWVAKHLEVYSILLGKHSKTGVCNFWSCSKTFLSRNFNLLVSEPTRCDRNHDAFWTFSEFLNLLNLKLTSYISFTVLLDDWQFSIIHIFWLTLHFYQNWFLYNWT